MENKTYSHWFLAAAIYNLVWGTLNILFPKLVFEVLRMKPPETPYWQVVGMFVLVYAPAYFWASQYPDSHPHLIFVGTLGKVFGPIGFLWAYFRGYLPLSFGIINIFNDIVWLPVFIVYLHEKIGKVGIRQFMWGEIVVGNAKK